MVSKAVFLSLILLRPGALFAEKQQRTCWCDCWVDSAEGRRIDTGRAAEAPCETSYTKEYCKSACSSTNAPVLERLKRERAQKKAAEREKQQQFEEAAQQLIKVPAVAPSRPQSPAASPSTQQPPSQPQAELLKSKSGKIDTGDPALNERIEHIFDAPQRPFPPGPGASDRERMIYQMKMNKWEDYQKRQAREQAKEAQKAGPGAQGAAEGPKPPGSAPGDAEARKRQLAQELATLQAPSVPFIENPSDPASQKKLQEYRTEQAAYDQKVKGLQEELKGLDAQKLQTEKSELRKAAGIPEPPAEKAPSSAFGQPPASAGSRTGPAVSETQTPPPGAPARAGAGKTNLPDAQTLFEKTGLTSGQGSGGRGPLGHVTNLEGLKEEAGEGFAIPPTQEADVNLPGVPKALPKVLPGQGTLRPPPVPQSSQSDLIP